MSEVIQQQLEDIKQRLTAVEHKAENRAAVGPRGPQGPPGFHSNVPGPQGNTGPTGPAGRDGRDGRTPGKEEVESMLVTLLQEYHLLDSDSLPYAGPYAKK
jgi:hypothetical protein